jgi:hypothetical protein
MEYGDSRLGIAAGLSCRLLIYGALGAAIFGLAWWYGSIPLGFILVLFGYTCWVFERHRARGRRFLRSRYAGTPAEKLLKTEKDIRAIKITETPWGWLYESEAVERAARKHTDRGPLFPVDP